MWVSAGERLEPTANSLFGRLPGHVQQLLSDHLEYVTLNRHQPIYAPGDAASAVLFPLTSVMGVVNESEDGASSLLALVGCDGLVGLPAIMRRKVLSLSVVVCMPGVALRVPAAPLRAEFDKNVDARQTVLDYMQAFAAEMIETAHCSRHHTPTQQLCVLILRATDQHRDSGLSLTHEQMGSMLGVRRETVSHAANALYHQGILMYKRGRVQVLDRERLEQVACGCYRKIRTVYEEIAQASTSNAQC